MALPKNDNLTEEVETRLDELFDENDGSLEGVGTGDNLEDSPLRELRAIVLSIDWEITDEAMTRFIDQVDRLKTTYKDDRLLLLFLQLLGPLGKYIKANKSRCLPEAIQLLNSVYTNFEKVATSEAMPRQQKKKILMAEVVRFKELKELIAAHQRKNSPQKADAPPALQSAPEDKAPVAPQGDDETVTLSRADLAFLVSELTHVIRAEFDALKNVLQTLCGSR